MNPATCDSGPHGHGPGDLSEKITPLQLRLPMDMIGDKDVSLLPVAKRNPKKRASESSCTCTCRSRSRSSSHRWIANQNEVESRSIPSYIKLKILSASYGPCEHYHEDETDETSIPSTRDCTSFVLDLLVAARKKEQGPRDRDEQHQHQHQPRERERERDELNSTVRLAPTVDGKVQSFIYLLPGVDRQNHNSHRSSSESMSVSMNAIFGDPCPGKTKRLEVRYTVTEVFGDYCSLRTESSQPPAAIPPTEIHRASFAEHETVKLRRCLTTINTVVAVLGKMGEEGERLLPEKSSADSESIYCFHCSPSIDKQLPFQLRPEIVLPIILPFLDLWERMQCRLICRSWKTVVRECGVSRSIDVNNTDVMTTRKSTAAAAATATNNGTFNPSILRGLLAYSYSSLQSLFLSGFGELEKNDLHNALPHLRNLRVLDVSYCLRLDDSTLQLLARSDVPSNKTLRVLYLKGLRRMTDVGLKAICHSCHQLEVLDLSHLTNITDESASCIQQLIFLRALFLRDNWRLTNCSFDAITTSCSKLEQLTLWGCVGLRRLKFDCGSDGNDLGASALHTTTCISNLMVILNLWGCHDLEDDSAKELSCILNLKTLIVSECHRLTDRFVQSFVDGQEQCHRGKGSLQHLHLRYLKRITDAALVAIALKLRDLFSLDLTFCSKVTAIGIYRLLDELRESLVELRLKSCRGLQIGRPNKHGDNGRRRMVSRQRNNNYSNHAGHWVLNALRRRPHSTVHHTLCLLDVRGCGGQPGHNLPYTEEDPFVKGMSALSFRQIVPGFFSRSI